MYDCPGEDNICATHSVVVITPNNAVAAVKKGVVEPLTKCIGKVSNVNQGTSRFNLEIIDNEEAKMYIADKDSILQNGMRWVKLDN